MYYILSSSYTTHSTEAFCMYVCVCLKYVCKVLGITYLLIGLCEEVLVQTEFEPIIVTARSYGNGFFFFAKMENNLK
jgi:hypothetical protein